MRPAPQPALSDPTPPEDAAGLGAVLARAALHEVWAERRGDAAAASGLAAVLAHLAGAGRPIVWVRQDMVETDGGRLDPVGLSEIGIPPENLLLVRAHSLPDVLKAGLEAARCGGLGAVLIEPWGEGRALDLTATRRLALAARESGVAALLLRRGDASGPSAALSRWRAEPLPSRALLAEAPGHPAFALSLLRHRAGWPPRTWRVEWNRDRARFQDRDPGRAPLSRPLVPLPADRPLAAAELRRAG